jgi:hypothetical protein
MKMKTKTKPEPKIVRKSGRNIWKIFAIVVVIVFLLILAGGVMRLYRFKSEFTPATEAQIEAAKRLVTADLEARGLNTTDYDITVPDRIHDMDKKGTGRTMLPARAYSNSSKHDYLIDLEAGMIVMHSQTDTYGWMADQMGKEGCGQKERKPECGRIREMAGPTRGMMLWWMPGMQPRK